jgi:HEAT repeat protein
LESGPDSRHRAAAADALGYADESKEQIAALVHASLDPSGEVRNNAIRALGVLADFDPKAIVHIPIKPYIRLMHSVDWVDRNKTVFLIDSFTTTRAPEVLRVLRSDALVPLCEIAQWQDAGHASAPSPLSAALREWMTTHY